MILGFTANLAFSQVFHHPPFRKDTYTQLTGAAPRLSYKYTPIMTRAAYKWWILTVWTSKIIGWSRGTIHQLGLSASQLAQVRAELLSIEIFVAGEVGAASGTRDFTVLPGEDSRIWLFCTERLWGLLYSTSDPEAPVFLQKDSGVYFILRGTRRLLFIKQTKWLGIVAVALFN